MSEHEGDIKNHNSKEGSGEKKFSSGSGESFKDWYDKFRKKEEARKDKSEGMREGQGKKKEEPKKEKKIVSGGKQSKDIIRLFRDFISLPVNQTPEMFQFALDSAKKEYSKGKISEKQFKELERSVKDRLSQLGREKIDSKKQFHEGIKPEDTSKKEPEKRKEKKKIPPKEEKEKDKKTSERKKSTPNFQEFDAARRKFFDESFKILDQARSYYKNDEEPPENLRKASEEVFKLLLSKVQERPIPGKDFSMPFEQMKELEEQIPDFRKEFKEKGNLDDFEKWFMKRVYALHEEYANERFDTNFTLTWPLQQALNKLWPIESDEGVNVSGRNMVEEINRVRKELTSKFEAHRNFHNFIYLYKRVSGVAGVVEASVLFDVRQIEVLMKDPRVAEYLRDYEELGERCRKLFDERLKKDIRPDSPDEKEVNRINDEKDKITKQAQELQIGRKDGEDIKKDRWAAVMAGGIYSALHQAGKNNLIMNTGDFFIGRLFNVDTKAKELWEGSWKRAPNYKLYRALELKNKPFWQEFLGKRFEEFRKEDEGYIKEYEKIRYGLKGRERVEALKKLHEGKIEAFQNKFWDDYKIKLKLEIKEESGEFKKIKNYSLKEAEFDKIDFEEMEDNSLTRIDVELLDADPVRKLILKPRQFIEKPTANKLNEMWIEFQHLKGTKRSAWFREVLKQMCLYYRDQTAPWLENLPFVLRKSHAQEINSEWHGWSNVEIEHIIGAFAPPLTPKDQEKLMEEFVGTKFERVFSKGWKNTAMIVLFAAWGGVKGFFDGFIKYLSSEKR